MPVTIGGSGPITGVTSINTTVTDTELGYLDGVTSAIQSQINTAGGLVLITTQTFSAVSSISVNNCFTSTYDNYLMVGVIVGSADAALNFRMRASGTDNTANSYNSIGYYVGSGVGPARIESTSQNLARFGSVNTTGYANRLEIFGPAANSTTRFSSSVGGNLQTSQWGGSHEVIAAYDGISILPSSGTITGTIRVYGMKN